MTNVLATLLLVMGVGQTPPAAPPRDPATQTVSAVISGLISEQGSGRPMPGALVTLWTAGSSERSREVLADGQGRYEFTGVEPGEYALFAAPGESRATHLRQAFGQPASMDVSIGMPPSTLVLRPAEVRSNVDIALTRALAIEGRVFDDRDQPMAEVEVRVVRADGTPTPAMPAHSDDRGVFRLWGLPPGRYRVCTAAPRGLVVESASDTSRFVSTCHLASTSESKAVDVLLETADAEGIDIRVQRSETYSVSGSVVDAAGVLVDGAFVGAARDDHEASAHDRTQNGRFVLKGLLPGRYVLRAGIGGPANPSDLHPPARERELAYTTIVVDGGDVSGVDVQMSKGRTIAGRVIFDGRSAPRSDRLRMVVQTLASQRLEWGPWPFGRPPFSAVNDKLEFELRELFQFPLTIGLQNLPDGWVVKRVRYEDRDISDLSTDFGAASPRARLEIVLSNRVALPAVRVTDGQGLPVTSYQIAILPVDPNRWRGAVWSVQGSPTRDGTLTLGPRLPGDYLVAALTGEDYRMLLSSPARLESLAAVARRVRFVEGENPTLELHVTKLPAAGER
jgi:protocatechuate 3,4-dioxygenase beta subunit